MSNKKVSTPELTSADVEAIRSGLSDRPGAPRTKLLNVLEQVANTAPPKKQATKATKSEPKHCAKEGCKLYAQQPSEFCNNHKPAVERLTTKEQGLLSTWINLLQPDERLAVFVQVLGPVKAKQLAATLARTTL